MLNFKDDGKIECRDYHKYTSNSTCYFVKNTPDCQIDGGFISYLSFAFCSFDGDKVWLSMIILFFWLFVLFIGLGVTADTFFCPSLRVIADTMRLSQNIAGVTFLAFGNGAPDVFSAIAAITNAKDGDAGLAFGALFGAGIFVSTVVAGTICVIRPFRSVQRPLLRDIIFFIMAAFWAFKVCWDGYISIYETMGFLVLYVVYIIVVVSGRYINQRLKRLAGGTAVERRSEFSSRNVQDAPFLGNVDAEEDDLDGERASYTEEHAPLLGTQRRPDSDKTFLYDALNGVNLYSKEEWQEANIYTKILNVIKAPVQFILKLTIPLVDYERPQHNWNKFIILVNFLLGPVLAVFAINLGFAKVFHVLPAWALALIIGVVFDILIIIFTDWRQKPRAYWLVSYFGFIMSVLWIYTIANEIVNLLTAFGVILNISNTILGLTFLAWGNSLSDFVADVISAKQGYPNMGMSACFGGPLFNILLGVGIPFSYGCIKKGTTGFTIKQSLLQDVLALFVGISLISTLLFVIVSNFHFTRKYGFYLLFLYIVALVMCILVEIGII